MTDSTIAAILFFMYVLNDQWAFRCQRVGRGILLLARDSAVAHTDLLASLLPTRYVVSIWVGRLILVGTALFAWRAWRWYGVVPVVLYVVVLGALVDSISPWPSYRGLLMLIRDRIRAGAAGANAVLLLPVVRHIEKELEAGVHFEKATTDVWLSRAGEATAAQMKGHDSEAAVENDDGASPTISQIEGMARRDHIKELALSVGRGLTAYIEVHNTIFHEASTFKSVGKNLLGRGVPMATLLADSEALLPLWTRIHIEVAEFRRSANSELTLDERRYLDLLSRYVDAVERTVAALVERQRVLNEGSRGMRNSPLTWASFQKAERQYQEAINEYKAVGLDLNNAAPIVFG